MLCGSGTTGCHGLIEEFDAVKRRQLALHIREYRLDTCSYLNAKFPYEKASDWLQRVYGA